MTSQLTPHPARQRSPRRFATPGLARFLAALALLVAVAAPVAGVAYALNGATQARADVRVQVRVTDRAALRIPLGSTPDRQRPVALQPQGGDTPGTLRLHLPGDRAGVRLEAPLDTLTLRAWDSTVAEQLLSRAGAAVLLVCIGVGAWLLRRLLLSIAAADPFQPGNPRRIAGIAALVVVAALATPLLPTLAGAMVLDRLRVGPGGPVAPLRAGIDLLPFLAALVLLALAEAFRRGGELARDTEGLV